MEQLRCNEGVQCPNCGHINEDTDHLANNRMEGEMDCGDCGESMKYEAEITVDWLSSRLPNNELTGRTTGLD